MGSDIRRWATRSCVSALALAFVTAIAIWRIAPEPLLGSLPAVLGGGETFAGQVDWEYRPLPTPPQHKFVLLFESLDNMSDDEVTIRRIEPVLDDDSAGVFSAEVDLAERREDSSFVALSRYVSDPPTSPSEAAGESDCVVAEVVDSEGYVMPPQDTSEMLDVPYVVEIEGLDEGEGQVRAMDVTYQRKGWVRTQRIRFGLRVEVDGDAEAMEPTQGEQRCLDEGHSQLLND